MIKRTSKRTIAGVRHGEHHCLPFMIFLLIAGALSGSAREGWSPWLGALMGGTVMLMILAPLFLWGCWENGKRYCDNDNSVDE